MNAHSGRTSAFRREFAPMGPSSFQTMSVGSPNVLQQGIGDDATRDMLSRLAGRMRFGGYPWPAVGTDAWSSEDNDAIPSGYTYLAQLAAHDLVQNTAQLPLVSDYPGELQRDYRAQRLVLDTVYGGGPGRDPLPYAVDMAGRADRCLFRLGNVRAREPQPFDQNPPPPLSDQPARDIPRVRCPHLSDHPSARVAPDALIADTRNDQHLVISQLTALFHQFHNILFKKVRALQDVPRSPLAEPLNFPDRTRYASGLAFGDDQDDIAFLHTRKLVALVYRRIVLEDLLHRLLETGVYQRYVDALPATPPALVPTDTSGRVQKEFSHSAFRFGHVMARFSYKLNDLLEQNPSLKNVLDRSGSNRRDLLPLAANWLVDWSHFFDMGNGKALNFSRRISPFVANGPLVTDELFRNQGGRFGGLFYKDFLRGYEADVETVDALIARLPPSEVARSDLLKDANLREHEVGRWLTHAAGAGFSCDEKVHLSKHPPLLLFVLFEAAYTQAGRRLGILGSTIIADVFFNALKANRASIEDDPAVPVLASAIFSAAVPADMPALVRYIKAEGGLADVVVTA